ncbi:hypothetical protein ACHWQZ_G016093 [Mnemiopsis leidyi]
MEEDPGGFFSLSPCFWFCCIRKRPRRAAAEDVDRASNRSYSFSYSESSSDDEDYDVRSVGGQKPRGGNEGDKLAGEKSGYGATEDSAAVLKVDGDKTSSKSITAPIPILSVTSFEGDTVLSPDSEPFSEEEEGEAFAKPLECLITASERNSNELEQDQNSEGSSNDSIGEIHVIGDADSYCSLSMSASRDRLVRKPADVPSVDRWQTNDNDEDAAPVASCLTNASPPTIRAETSPVKSWSKDETASLDQEMETAEKSIHTSSAPTGAEKKTAEISSKTPKSNGEPFKTGDTSQKISDPSPNETHQKSSNSEPVDVRPVPSIEINSGKPLEAKESIKSRSSDDSGVVADKFSPLKSQSAVLSDGQDGISLRSASSTASLDATGVPKKKKKKLKIFKKLPFKRKKKNKLLAQQEAGYSASSPALAGDIDATSSNMSANSKSRYSASLLLASLDDLSDEDIWTLSDNSHVTDSQTEDEFQDGTEVGGQIHCQQTGFLITNPNEEDAAPVYEQELKPVELDAVQPMMQTINTIKEKTTSLDKDQIETMEESLNADSKQSDNRDAPPLIEINITETTSKTAKSDRERFKTEENIKKSSEPNKTSQQLSNSESVDLRTVAAIETINAGTTKKKKKKIFKKLPFKRKKKNKLLAQQEAGYSASSPALAGDIGATSSNMSANSKRALSDNSNVTNSQTEDEVKDGTEVGGQIPCERTGYGATDDIELATFLRTNTSNEDAATVYEQELKPVELDTVQPMIQTTSTTENETSKDSKSEIQSLSFDGLSLCDFASLPLINKSHSATFSRNSEAVSTNSEDGADLVKKKKKRLHLKNFRIKKKKCSDPDQSGSNYQSSVDSKEFDESPIQRSSSTPIIYTADSNVKDEKKQKPLKKLLFSKKKTSTDAYSKYTSSSLLASFDSLNDDNICKE